MMRKTLLLVLVTALLILGLSANSVVYAQTNITDCAACHGTTTDFTTPLVDKTSACNKCHWQPYHTLTELGWPVQTPYGWFRLPDSPFYPSTTIHAAHDGSNRYSQYPYDTYGCAICHKAADCSSCHSSVSHLSHSNTKYTAPTLTVCDGTSWYSTTLSCAKSLCHSQLPTIISQPVCTNCHPTEGHGDVTALHVSPQLTPSCISSNCHSSSSLNIEHQNRGYDCATCHNNLDPNRAATCRNAIDSHNTNCSACHTVHGDINQIHTATNIGIAYRGYECAKCHITNVIPEHDAKPSSSTYGRSCSTCHPSPRNTFTLWDKSCMQGGCHTATTGPGSFHTDDLLKHTSPSTDCTACHPSDINQIHQNTVASNDTTSCGVSNLYGGCHTTPDEVPTVKTCETCHPDKTSTNHGYNAVQHTATNANANCTTCHYLEMKPEHIDKYGHTCATCHPSPRDKLGTWDKTCSQICHQETIHAEQTTLHQSTTTDCTSCHGTDVGTVHKTNCSYCHTQSKIPTTTDCYSCHLGHGDITALHESPELTPGCLGSTCHFSSKLTTEHENRGYDCLTCHNNPDPTRAATCRNAINSHNTNCSACHTVHGDITQVHTATNIGTAYRGYKCVKCHLTNVIPEHDTKPSSSTYGKGCSTCHPSPRNSFVTWNKSCMQGGCHTATSGAGSVHKQDTAKHTAVSSGCYCHEKNVSKVHARTTKSCGISNSYGSCHTSPNTVPTVTKCEICHPNKHKWGSWGGWGGWGGR